MLRRFRTVRIAGVPVQERFVRSAGPSGQNADHDATAVELRVDVAKSPLPLEVQSRLREQNRNRVTKDGTLTVVVRASRSQLENRQAARARLTAILDRAMTPDARRIPTAPVSSARETRLHVKHGHTALKRRRAKLAQEELS